MKPRSINIFLLDGDPNGIRVAQIMMSTIQAIAFLPMYGPSVLSLTHVTDFP